MCTTYSKNVDKLFMQSYSQKYVEMSGVNGCPELPALTLRMQVAQFTC